MKCEEESKRFLEKAETEEAKRKEEEKKALVALEAKKIAEEERAKCEEEIKRLQKKAEAEEAKRKEEEQKALEAKRSGEEEKIQLEEANGRPSLYRRYDESCGGVGLNAARALQINVEAEPRPMNTRPLRYYPKLDNLFEAPGQPRPMNTRPNRYYHKLDKF